MYYLVLDAQSESVYHVLNFKFINPICRLLVATHATLLENTQLSSSILI